MDWKDLGKTLGKIAPAVGMALGGPMGGAIGAGVASALGVDNDPSAVKKALEHDPEAAVRIQAIEADLRKAAIEAEKEESLANLKAETDQQSAVNATMRAEYEAQGTFKTGWRPFIGWIFGLCIAALVGSLVYAILQDPTVVSDPSFTGLLIWLFTSMAALLGVNIHSRSKDKQAAMGFNPQGLIGAMMKRG